MRRQAAVGALAGALVVSAACGGVQSVLDPQGPAAHRIWQLMWLLFGVLGVVYAAVMAALAWAMLRRRRANPDDAAAEKRLKHVVGAAVGATAAILVLLTGASAFVGRTLTPPDERRAVKVAVVGHQWWWDFQYRSHDSPDVVSSPNELHVPVGVPVVLDVQSRDVIHSFWVPNLQGKRDLIPGQTTRVWLQADTPGVYRGQCAEFCGFQHAKMAFLVIAEPLEKFQAWIAHQKAPAAEPTTDPERRGRDALLQSTCVTCHTIRGTDAASLVGPDLTHVGSRATLGAATVPNARDPLQQWVANPHSVKPGVRMPGSALPPEELDAVISYLRSLR